ncbi:endonuclease/exonuclease/phosphatase family protein [Camelimonas sp. ID_303_24]
MSNKHLPLLLLVIAGLVAAPLALGFAGGLHPAFDSFAHFRTHLAVLTALLALPLLFTARRRGGAALVLLAAAAFATTFGAFNQPGGQDAQAAGGRYRLIQINLRFDNRTPERLLDMIARENPDIIAYQEGGAHWAPWLDRLAAAYPHRLHCPRASGVMAVGLLSRHPFRWDNGSRQESGADHAAPTAPGCAGDGLMAIAPVNLGGVVVRVASLHLEWPWPFAQQRNLRQIRPELEKLRGPRIIAGDFNATPWSHTVRQVEVAASARAMGSARVTWFTWRLPAALRPYLGLPIDQILVSRDIIAPRLVTLDHVGSDHLPVRLDFSTPPASSQTAAL